MISQLAGKRFTCAQSARAVGIDQERLFSLRKRDHVIAPTAAGKSFDLISTYQAAGVIALRTGGIPLGRAVPFVRSRLMSGKHPFGAAGHLHRFREWLDWAWENPLDALPPEFQGRNKTRPWWWEIHGYCDFDGEEFAPIYSSMDGYQDNGTKNIGSIVKLDDDGDGYRKNLVSIVCITPWLIEVDAKLMETILEKEHDAGDKEAVSTAFIPIGGNDA